MNEFEVKSVKLKKLESNSDGFMLPLCDKCKNKSCPLPIETRTVALPIVGNRKMRLLCQGSNVNVVVACKGFMKK